MNKLLLLTTTIFLLLATTVLATDFEQLGTCYEESISVQGTGDNRTTFTIINTCEAQSQIRYLQDVELVLGSLQEGQVTIQKNEVTINSISRPDLDVPAEITLHRTRHVYQPNVYRDGNLCMECNITSFNRRTGTITFEVPGFSTYTLQEKQQFELYSDHVPELKKKVYQTIDLGPGYRSAENMTCNVMIFAEDSNEDMILVQTNPERAIQSRMFGSPDMNQPESLGYFPVKNGVANVYFRNDLLVGYTDFVYVALCQDQSTQLVFEEIIRPMYSPVDRNVVARAEWFMTDNEGRNASLISVALVAGIMIIWLLAMIWRSFRFRGPA